MGERLQRNGTHGRTDEGGLSILVTGIALVATALLTLVAVGATLSSGGPASSSGTGNPQVATADHIQAQQVLSTSLQALSTSAVSGGVGGVGGSPSTATDIAQLVATDPSVSYVAGPATDASTVSVATDPTAAGAVTLATRSADGVCWLVFSSPGSSTWYGAQSHLASCTAPVLAAVPSPGPVTSTAIGWQTSAFPSA